jgi:hypothetical protein
MGVERDSDRRRPGPLSGEYCSKKTKILLPVIDMNSTAARVRRVRLDAGNLKEKRM